MKKDRLIAILTTLMFSATAFTGCIPTRTLSASELTPSGSLASVSDVASFSDSSEAASSESDVVYNVETIEVPNLPVSEESFLEYFKTSQFTRCFFGNVEKSDFLIRPGNGFLFLIWQTYLLETERGVTFEKVDSYDLIPGEMIRRTASDLLGLELTADELYAMSDGKERPRSDPMGLRRVEGSDSYFFTLGFGIGEGYLTTIHRETLQFSKQEISIQTTLTPDEGNPDIPPRRFTYYFRVIEGNRIPYQLMRITED